MNEKSDQNEQKLDNEDQKPVNDLGGFYFSSAIKIFDPNSEEIIVQQRGDN